MKNLIITLLLFVSAPVLYANPVSPSLRINEFGFTNKGWAIELSPNPYWAGSIKLRFVSNTDTSDFFSIKLQEDFNYYNFFYVITNDSVNNSLYINPAGDQILVFDSLGNLYDYLIFGQDRSYIDTLKTGQSICFGRKPLGKIFYYLDNTPTYGAPNDSAGGMGVLTGVLKDTLGHRVANAKVFYNYETQYGAGDIYVLTNDSGYFYINNFAEKVLLKFKADKFFDEKIRVQIYPDSTINLEIILKTDILSSVEQDKQPFNFNLEQNYPNPFNPSTRIKYSISNSISSYSRVELKVYDVLGSIIVTLVNKEQSPGQYEVIFDASKYNLSSGFYFYVLRVGGQQLSRKMCLIK